MVLGIGSAEPLVQGCGTQRTVKPRVSTVTFKSNKDSLVQNPSGEPTGS